MLNVNYRVKISFQKVVLFASLNIGINKLKFANLGASTSLYGFYVLKYLPLLPLLEKLMGIKTKKMCKRSDTDLRMLMRKIPLVCAVKILLETENK